MLKLLAISAAKNAITQENSPQKCWMEKTFWKVPPGAAHDGTGGADSCCHGKLVVECNQCCWWMNARMSVRARIHSRWYERIWARRLWWDANVQTKSLCPDAAKPDEEVDLMDFRERLHQLLEKVGGWGLNFLGSWVGNGRLPAWECVAIAHSTAWQLLLLSGGGIYDDDDFWFYCCCCCWRRCCQLLHRWLIVVSVTFSFLYLMFQFCCWGSCCWESWPSAFHRASSGATTRRMMVWVLEKTPRKFEALWKNCGCSVMIFEPSVERRRFMCARDRRLDARPHSGVTAVMSQKLQGLYCRT